MANNPIPETTKFSPPDQYSVGVSPDFQFVLFNLPPSRPEDEVQHQAFSLLLTPEQADALVDLLKRCSAICRSTFRVDRSNL